MNNKIFGYARVSSKEQNEERQLVAFKDLGINERDIYIDKQSGKDFDRKQFHILKNVLRENDLLVIKSIDRLGRNYQMIIDEWKDITKNIKADILVIDMPLLDTRNNKDLLGTFISDLVLQILSYYLDSITIKDYENKGKRIENAKLIDLRLKSHKINRLLEYKNSNMIDEVLGSGVNKISVAEMKHEKDALEYIELLRKQYKFAVFDFYKLEDYYLNPLLFKIIKVNPKCVAEKKKVFGLFLLEPSAILDIPKLSIVFENVLKFIKDKREIYTRY